MTRIESDWKCPYCQKPIAEGDQYNEMNGGMLRAHHACGLRAVVGGLNHLLGLCTCCGGTLAPDPPGVTRREAAELAAEEYYRQQRVRTRS